MPYNIIDPGTAATAPATTLGVPKTSVGMTLGSMEARLARQLAGRGDVDSPFLQAMINDAYVDVCSSLKLPELFGSFALTTVVDQPFYMLPDIVEYIREAAVVDPTLYSFFGGRPLTKITLDTYRKEPDEVGPPAGYFREGEVFVLYPTPDAIVTVGVDVKLQPAPLVNATDSPIVPIQFHEVILKCARAKAFDELQEFELHAAAENSWISLLRRKEDPLAEEQSTLLVGSSVPRRARDLIRPKSRRDPDGLY